LTGSSFDPTAIRVVRLDSLRNPLDRPIRQPGARCKDRLRRFDRRQRRAELEAYLRDLKTSEATALIIEKEQDGAVWLSSHWTSSDALEWGILRILEERRAI